MEMLANIGRNESEFRVILTGREVDSSLAGLLFDHEGSAKESAVAASKSNYDADENGCDAQTVAESESSSISAPSGLMSSSTMPSGQVSSMTMPSCLDYSRPIPQCQWQFRTIDADGGSNSARRLPTADAAAIDTANRCLRPSPAYPPDGQEIANLQNKAAQEPKKKM